MNANEKLIEEAAKAVRDANEEYGEFVGSGSAPWETFIARAALAVFEKAHTPTDDEREAQGWREAELYASADGDARDDFMTGWRTADRLRRSEVPEPVFPGETIAEAVEIMREAETRRTIPAQAQGEPSDGQVDAGAQALFNEMLRESSIGDVNGTFERCRDSARLVLRAAGVTHG